MKKIIADKEFMRDVTNDINSLEFEKAEKATGQIGWSYIIPEVRNESKSIR